MKAEEIKPAPAPAQKPTIRYPAMFRGKQTGSLYLQSDAEYAVVLVPAGDYSDLVPGQEINAACARADMALITEPVTITFTP